MTALGTDYLDYLVAALLGALVGAAELVSRYRDTSTGALKSWAGLTYIAINATASTVALLVAVGFRWDFGMDPFESEQLLRWVRVAATGLGAMAIFRSALLTRRIGDVDVPIGPAAILSVILDAADRQVDRQRAQVIAKEAKRLMAGLDYARARDALATTGLVALQNISGEDQGRLADKLRALDDPKLAAFAKLQALGEVLVQTFGPELVDELVKAMRADLLTTAQSGSSTATLSAAPAAPPLIQR
jgi:hypothetical protein